MNKSVWANLAGMVSGLCKMLIALFAGAEDAVAMGRVAIGTQRRQQAIRVRFEEKKFKTTIVATMAVNSAKIEEGLLEYAKSNPERAALVKKHKDELEALAETVLKEFDMTEDDE